MILREGSRCLLPALYLALIGPVSPASAGQWQDPVITSANESMAVETLVRLLQENPSPADQARAGALLAQRGSEAIPALVAALDRTQDYDAAARILWGLLHSAADPGPELVTWLRRAVPVNRFAFEDGGTPAGTPPERGEEEEASPLVVDPLRAVRLILGRRGGRSVAVTLDLLEDVRPDLRGLAYDVVSDLGAQAAPLLPALVRRVADGAVGERRAAVAAVAAIGEPARETMLAWLAQHPSSEVRTFAAHHIELHNTTAAGLVAALNDPERSVRLAAAGRLEELLNEAAPGTISAETAVLIMQADLRSDSSLVTLSLGAVDLQSPALQPLAPQLLARLRQLVQQDNGQSENTSGNAEAQARALAGMPVSWGFQAQLLALAEDLISAGKVEPALMILELVRDAGQDTAIPADASYRLFRRADRAERRDLARRIVAVRAGVPGLSEALIEEIEAVGATEGEGNVGDYSELVEALADADVSALRTLPETVRAAGPDDAFCEALRFALDDLARDAMFARNAARDARWAALSDVAERTCRRPFLLDSHAETTAGGSDPQAAAEAALLQPDPTTALLAIASARGQALENGLRDAICPALTLRLVRPSVFRALIDDVSFDEAADLADGCLVLWDESISWAFVHRIGRDTPAFLSWAWGEREGEASAEPPLSEPGSDVLAVVRRSLQDRGAGEADAQVLVRLIAVRDWRIATFAIEVARSLRHIPEPVGAAIIAQTRDSDHRIAAAAIEAALTRGLLDLDAVPRTEAERLSDILIATGLIRDLWAFVEEADVRVRSSSEEDSVIVTSAERRRLPPLPWPPPVYSQRVVFGADADLSLLGTAATTLGVVHQKLIRALRRASLGFEYGLFGAPGGYAMVTRLEQTDAEGRPLPGHQRWLDVRPPPSSLSDYFARLVLAPPGHYRTIIFLFTNRPNFQPSAGLPPSTSGGGAVLPPEIARLRLGDVTPMALIYYFQRRDGGRPRLSKTIAGPLHLVRAGITGGLQQP